MFTAWLSKNKNRQRLAALGPRLRRLALAWCGEESLADDLAQETLTRALSRIDSLRDGRALESWAFAILANCFRDHCRRQPSVDPFDECADPALAPAEEQLSQQQTTDRVRQAIGRLSASQREVLLLVDLESFSYAETAQILGIPVGTVMSRLSRARQNLKQRLLTDRQSGPNSRPFMERVK